MSIRLQCSINIQADTFPPSPKNFFIPLDYYNTWNWMVKFSCSTTSIITLWAASQSCACGFFPIMCAHRLLQPGYPLFFGHPEFFAVWLQTSFPWFFPLASIFISSRVKTWKNVCYFTIKFRLLLSGCRILFLSLILQKKVYGTSSSNPILWHWFKGVIYPLDACKCCALNTWFSKWIKSVT